MNKGLTKEEMRKLERIFCPRDVEIILSKFSKKHIRKVINHPTFEN